MPTLSSVMSSPIIQVENLGKKFRLHHQHKERYTTLRDTLARKVKALVNPSRNTANFNADEDFWALRDVSFEVKHGDVVGIIGRNGAGKSTLLKVLSRITEPTTGRITLNGRVASLLEVGTGFHPELTGRENIFLNGAILGMRKDEIKAKFDEIVAFAEVEKFLDTPVKRYSSGMYVRLAFAVAAHLEPEILVVDEVLAVGDADFQKKCLGKMQDVSRQSGRTVLFVSHNLIAVQQLCTHALVMHKGKVIFSGGASEGISSYLDRAETQDELDSDGWINVKDAKSSGSGDIAFERLRIVSKDGRPSPLISVGEAIHVEIEFATAHVQKDLIVGFAVHDQFEEPLFATHWNDYGQTYSLNKGRWQTRCLLSPNYLRPGSYTISLGAISSGVLHAHIMRAASFTIEPILGAGTGHHDNRIGKLFVPMKWAEPVPAQLDA